MKILVMGAGAVGAYFGARLQAAGEELIFCARGANLSALRERGLQVQSISGDLALRVTACEEPREFAPYDLILFTVKVYDTERAAEQIDNCLKPGGAILTLQNGVESESRLISIFGRESVMGGNARVGVELVGPGRVVHLSTGVIEFGEVDGGETERARKIADALQRAGILGSLTNGVHSLRWRKLVWNAAFNSITALSRRTVGEVLDDSEGRELVLAIMHEVRTVALADGAQIEEDWIDQLIRHSDANLRKLKTSTLQDLERGKRMEYDAIIGAVVRTARRHSVRVPASEATYALLKLLDGSR